MILSPIHLKLNKSWFLYAHMKRVLIIVAIILFIHTMVAQPIDGYWLMRAPTTPENYANGISYPKLYGDDALGGNGQDFGIMVRNNTLREGVVMEDSDRKCNGWGQYSIDEPDVDLPGTITQAYCHVWTNVRTNWSDQNPWKFGLLKGGFNALGDKFFPNDSLTTEIKVNNFYLTTLYEPTKNIAFATDEEVWDISYYHYAAVGDNCFLCYPQLVSYKNQRSYCIFNTFNSCALNDQACLEINDFDADGLNDYKELFVYFTDPYDEDTDDDSYDDELEILIGQNPLDPNDWGQKHIYDVSQHYTTNFNIYHEKQDFGETLRSPEHYNNTLAYELNETQYQSLDNFQTSIGVQNFSSVNQTHNNVFDQYNFHLTINENKSNIKNIQFFLGLSYYGGFFENNNTYVDNRITQIYNVTDEINPVYITGTKQYPSIFMAGVKYGVEDIIGPNNEIKFRYVVTSNQSVGGPAERGGILYSTQVWVIEENPQGDLNQDGKVDIIDLALTTYYQGKNNSQAHWKLYSLLDSDQNNVINFQDILETMAKI